MASRGPKPAAGAPGVKDAGEDGCSETPLPDTEDDGPNNPQGSGSSTAGAAKKQGPYLRRNVVSERERRRRISLSCERLRTLLPQFDGRREDMASVLEMAVRFLQLAHSLTPSWKHLSVPPPSQDMWHMWQSDALKVTLASQITDSTADLGAATVAASGMTQVQDSPFCGMQGMDQDQTQTLARVSELLERPPSCPGSCPDCRLDAWLWTRPCWATCCYLRLASTCPHCRTESVFSPSEPSSMSPGLLPWIPHPWQSTSPHVGEDFPGELYQAGPLARDTASPDTLAEESPSLHLTPVSDARYTTGSDFEDVTSFLLTSSPDWWSGSVEGRGSMTLARSSPVDRAELNFMEDSESSSQELEASPPELWGLDLGGGQVLKDEVDSIFPDFFAC